MLKQVITIGISLIFSGCVTTTAFVDNKEPKDSKLVPKETNARSLLELTNTINEIDSLKFIKGEYEKESEYLQRIKSLYEKYDGRRYEITASCNQISGEWEKKKLVYYDVEQEIMVLSLPEMDSESSVIRQGDKFKLSDFKYSFMLSAEPTRNSDTYPARNAFGAGVEVTSIQQKSPGVAMLTAGASPIKERSEFWNYDAYYNSMPKAKTIRIRLPRIKAQSVLSDCKVVFDVQSTYSAIWPYKKEQFISMIESARSMLFKKHNEIKPTISEPYHIVREQIALPVTLLSVKILSGQGEQLFLEKYY